MPKLDVNDVHDNGKISNPQIGYRGHSPTRGMGQREILGWKWWGC
jgi:hypothetical protein